MSSHTNREYEAWQVHLDDLEKEPSLHDWYLMQIAQEVCRVLSKRPNSIRLQQFKLKFEKKKKTLQTVEKVAAISKSRWFGFLGIKQKKDE